MQGFCWGFLRKEQLRFIAIFSVCLFVLVVISGCTEMTRQQKNLCFSMTTESYSYVPSCTTEKNCFDKVGGLFKTKFGYQEESDLYELKNHVARSWYFYNLAVKELGALKKVCSSGNAAGLGGGINQAKFFIDTSFNELDLAMKKSFSVVSAQEKRFSEEKIDLAKEEAVFDSLVELRAIISELSSGKTNSGTYVSFFMSKANAFNKSAFSKASITLIENTPVWIEGFEYFGGSIVREFDGATEGFFPLIAPATSVAFDYIENSFFSKQNLSALTVFSAKDFMKLYSDLGGANNSALKMFADLENRISANFSAAKENALMLWEKVQIKQNECVFLKKQLVNAPNYADIAGVLRTGGSVEVDSNFKTGCFAGEIILLREKKHSAKLTLGEELLELKNISNGLDREILRANYEKTVFVEELLSACQNKSKEIRSIDSNASGDLAALLLEAKFFAKKVVDSNKEESLLYCRTMLKKEELFLAGVADYGTLAAKLKDSTKDCFSFLEAILGWGYESGINAEFLALKNTELTRDNLLWFSESCEKIKERAIIALREDEDVREVENAFAKLKKTKESLNLIGAYFTDFETQGKISNATEKIAGYEEYFSDGKVRLDVALPVLGELSKSIIDFDKDLEEFVSKKVISYAKNNFKAVISDGNLPLLGETDFDAGLVIPNPFFGVNRSFEIDSNINVVSVLNKDPCITNFSGPNNSVILLSCLPLGGANASAKIRPGAKSNESDYFIYVSNKESLLRRDIVLFGNILSKSLEVKTNIPPKTFDFYSVVDGKEILPVKGGDELFFTVKNASSDSKIAVFFYIADVISDSLVLTKTKSTAGGEKLSYLLSAKNNSGFDVTAFVSSALPLGDAQSVDVFDLDYNPVSFDRGDDEILLKKVKFGPGEIKKYVVEVFVNSAISSYLSGLNEQLNYFLANGHAVEAEKLRDFLAGASELSAQKLAQEWETNAGVINEFEADNKAAVSLNAAISMLENQALELDNLQKNLRLLGFDREADEISLYLESLPDFSLLSAAEIFNIRKKMGGVSNSSLKTAKKMIDSFRSELVGIENNYSDENLLGTANNFFSFLDGFEENSTSDPAKALDYFALAKKSFEDINFKKSKIDENAFAKAAQENKEIAELAEICLDKIGFLEGELFGKDSKLIEKKFISPITDARLKKLRLLVADLRVFDGNYSDRLFRLNEIKWELSDAIDSVKSQAVAKFNLGIDLGFDRAILSQGKSLIDENRFVDAFLLLSASGASQGGKIPFEGLLPIVIIGIVAFVLKVVVGKKSKALDAKKKMVLDNWERN